MPKVSDAELRFHAKSDGPQPLQDIARELLAARAMMKMAKKEGFGCRAEDNCGSPLCATVERAQRKREAEAKELNYDGSKWHEYTDCPKQTGCEYCLRARPTFAEALQAEASDAGDFRLMHMIERARRASEGL